MGKPPAPIGGMTTATTASLSGRSIAARSPLRKSSGVALVVRSCGSKGWRPEPSATSWVSRPRESELPTIAMRGPDGSGWWASRSAASYSSVMVSTRITPACSKSVSTVESAIRVIAAACPAGMLRVSRPPFTTTSGLRAATRRARRLNLRGLPKDSR